MVEFYDHQKLAIEQLKSGSILCGGVGSGKSITSLGFYFLKFCGGDLKTMKMKTPMKLYIITTAMKRDTFEWNDECARFLLSDYVVDSWNNIKKYVDVKDSFFIFDEQRVVGNGAWVKAFLKITKNNSWLLLSATPGDTWTDYIPVFIANGFYKNRSEFIARHVVYNRFSKYPKVDRYIEQGRLIRLRNEILVDMDFLKPSESYHINVTVGYDLTKYKSVFKLRWNPYKDEPIKNASELCYVLRRILNSDKSRIDAVEKIIKTHSRVIIFYNFDYELEILLDLGEKLNIKAAQWNGHKHEPVPDEERWMYIVQYAAGAEGWNCIKTNAMIFYSQNYSYRATVQAAGRIDRLNTPYSNLYFYHLRSTAGIDVAISKALKQKKKFNEAKYVSKL